MAGVVKDAELLRQFVKRAELGLKAQNEAALLKVEAEVKAGELLAQMDRQGQGRPGEKTFDALTIPPRLDDLGVTRFLSHYWQQVAGMPDRSPG